MNGVGWGEGALDGEVREGPPEEVTLDLSDVLVKRVRHCKKLGKTHYRQGEEHVQRLCGQLTPVVLGT